LLALDHPFPTKGGARDQIKHKERKYATRRTLKRIDPHGRKGRRYVCFLDTHLSAGLGDE
jgi:hypothetical protein